MKQIFLSQKGIEVLDVPIPKIGEKELLVKNYFSCISPGTELAGFIVEGVDVLSVSAGLTVQHREVQQRFAVQSGHGRRQGYAVRTTACWESGAFSGNVQHLRGSAAIISVCLNPGVLGRFRNAWL